MKVSFPRMQVVLGVRDNWGIDGDSGHEGSKITPSPYLPWSRWLASILSSLKMI